MNQKKLKMLLGKLDAIRNRYYLIGLCLPAFLQDVETGLVHMTPEKWRQYRRYLIRRFGYGLRRGILQMEVDRNFENVLSDLKADFPYFDKLEIQVFSYSVAGIPDSLTARLSGISDAKAVYVIKQKMADTIKIKPVDRKEEYLIMLSD